MAQALLFIGLPMERRRQSPMPDEEGRAPTRLQTRTVALAPDELETVQDRAGAHAAYADIQAYLKANGIADEGTCLGDMVGSITPKVLPAPPMLDPRELIELPNHTVHAYCEPMLPFLPVEDLAAPLSETDPDPEELYEPAPLPRGKSDDPILEYLREVSADFAPTAEPTHFGAKAAVPLPLPIPIVQTPPPQIAPQPMAPEPTMYEQAAVKTTCGPYAKPGKSRSIRVLAVKKRRTPLWAGVTIGLLIAVLLLTSSVFTVEVLASKLSLRKSPPPVANVTKPEPKPWVVPR